MAFPGPFDYCLPKKINQKAYAEEHKSILAIGIPARLDLIINPADSKDNLQWHPITAIRLHSVTATANCSLQVSEIVE